MEPLGKGLESLIPEKSPDEVPDHVGADAGQSAAQPAPARETPPSASPLSNLGAGAPAARTFNDHFVPRRNDSVFWIEVEKIEPNPFQPRREFAEEALKDLAESIREHGVLQPILVTKREIETPRGLEVRYQLIAGERRWRAAERAGISQIPAVIRRGVPDDRIKLELALIENVQREDLNPVERARAFKRLVDEFHLVQREIASRIGKSREMVANALRLLTLPAQILAAIESGKISEGHARAILMAGDNAAQQLELFRAITEDRLNVRETEHRARQISGKPFVPKKRPGAVQNPQLREWQRQLQDWLGTKVQLQHLGGKGRVVVEFYSEEELRGILQKLMAQGERPEPPTAADPEPPFTV